MLYLSSVAETKCRYWHIQSDPVVILLRMPRTRSLNQLAELLADRQLSFVSPANLSLFNTVWNQTILTVSQKGTTYVLTSLSRPFKVQQRIILQSNGLIDRGSLIACW
jgi:hypothetical protein